MCAHGEWKLKKNETVTELYGINNTICGHWNFSKLNEAVFCVGGWHNSASLIPQIKKEVISRAINPIQFFKLYEEPAANSNVNFSMNKNWLTKRVL